ncbi:MAG: 50S ribosomal protein L25 [Planctomycetes bacterium]|nr:50S ribosomal protein L25 [Planctomycetota bacterium]MCB9910881.1 50S ribosomal protein L25 [Planctomycetota bacterium]MCB9912092.1 50S ribosomal protein L25 [Planctomycetota bacterium]HPF14591.1 50S ribosomal protein L25 [Planctomycetota bacterium]HRV80535.1 50S ribosomal protein L25 [Planctomycetota bacterium]
MSSSAKLKAELRTKLGSRDARRLRNEGRLPCSLQADANHEHVNFHLDLMDFLTTRRAHAHLYDLEIGGKVQAALVRELQYDALGAEINHVEFKAVTRGVKTQAEVELSFVGMVAEGVLTHNVTHISVTCLPSEIPDEIEVRVDGMVAGAHIKASDLVLPAGVALAEDADLEIAVVSALKAEVAAAAEEGAEATPEA